MRLGYRCRKGKAHGGIINGGDGEPDWPLLPLNLKARQDVEHAAPHAFENVRHREDGGRDGDGGHCERRDQMNLRYPGSTRGGQLQLSTRSGN